jgi:putative Holliday junction resolvase
LKLYPPILALDYGAVRIGIAISDPSCTLASPLLTIKNNAQAPAEVKKLSQKYGVSIIVVGFPYNMKGEVTASAQRVNKFIAGLEQENLKIIRWDERLSTTTATNLLHAGGVKIRGDKGRVDRCAAAVILQHFLDSRRDLSTLDT